MKKRIISLAIALLLVCGMPVSAFAETVGDNPVGTTVDTIDDDKIMETNNGTVETNNGTVYTNNGIVVNNEYYVSCNNGTVEANNGTVFTNNGEVTTNSDMVMHNGTSENNANSIVKTNNERVVFNYGTVGTNNLIVTENYGEVTTNNGTVTTNSSTGTVGTNNKTVDKNYGEVTTNETGGVVSHNGTATDNANAKVGTNNGRVTDNWGTVGTNNSIVDSNNDGAVVEINADNGTVNRNSGTVKANNGTVSSNSSHGTVETNNGTVGGNDGTVGGNDGTVTTNDGTVNGNYGTVATNSITGTVINYGGTVDTNYGTVIDGKDNYKTTYGVQVDGALFQKNEGEDFDLTQFTKDGYEFAGYTQEYQMVDGVLTKESITVNSTSYTADCPNILTLIWRALFSEDEGGYFGPGCYISVNGKQYILVEIKDGSYYLASCDEYTKEQLSDPDALLKTLLTEEQLDCVTGAAEVLNAELTETFFGGGSHIVFPCSKYLIFS